MTIFDHPIWPIVEPFARLASGRNNLDILQPPDDVRKQALAAIANCVACGVEIHPFRVRVKSKRSRVAGDVVERRLFYAATCPSSVNPGCSRTKAAKDHKKRVLLEMGTMKTSEARTKVVAMIDAALPFAPKVCSEAMLAAKELLMRSPSTFFS